MLRVIIHTIVLMMLAGILAAQDLPIIHQIDKQLNECINLDENLSTHGTLACIEEAYLAWTIEMEKTLAMLTEVLNNEENLMLSKSQKLWLEWHATEMAFSYAMHTNMGGSMYQIFAADTRVQIVRQRAIDLKSYYDTKTME